MREECSQGHVINSSGKCPCDNEAEPTPQRGDAIVGRTMDEERRPLVCFVCGERFAITFNFCLEHKNEYEALKAAKSQ